MMFIGIGHPKEGDKAFRKTALITILSLLYRLDLLPGNSKYEKLKSVSDLFHNVRGWYR